MLWQKNWKTDFINSAERMIAWTKIEKRLSSIKINDYLSYVPRS